MIDVTTPSRQCQLSALCRMRTANRRIRNALAARRRQRAEYSGMANHAQASPDAPGAPRGVINPAWGLVATILSVLSTAPFADPAAIAATMGKQHAVTVISRAWGRGIIGLCGIKVQIEGLENLAGLKSFILVANHQSFFE